MEKIEEIRRNAQKNIKINNFINAYKELFQTEKPLEQLCLTEYETKTILDAMLEDIFEARKTQKRIRDCLKGWEKIIFGDLDNDNN